MMPVSMNYSRNVAAVAAGHSARSSSRPLVSRLGGIVSSQNHMHSEFLRVPPHHPRHALDQKRLAGFSAIAVGPAEALRIIVAFCAAPNGQDDRSDDQ